MEGRKEGTNERRKGKEGYERNRRRTLKEGRKIEGRKEGRNVQRTSLSFSDKLGSLLSMVVRGVIGDPDTSKK